MTNQLQGEILFAGWAGDTDEAWAYTPWMTVRGDIATFAAEVLWITGSGMELVWEVQTRTVEDPTVTGIVAAQTVTVGSGPDVYHARNSTKAKQLVRYRFKTIATASVSSFVIFRALQPSWQVDRFGD